MRGVPNTKAQLNIAMKAMDEAGEVLMEYRYRVGDFHTGGNLYPEELIIVGRILRSGISKVNKAKQRIKS